LFAAARRTWLKKPVGNPVCTATLLHEAESDLALLGLLGKRCLPPGEHATNLSGISQNGQRHDCVIDIHCLVHHLLVNQELSAGEFDELSEVLRRV
jgi:hypothetical protein